MGPEDASAAITRDRLDPREWQTLRAMGITTTAALADLDPDDPAFFDQYYPEVTHHSQRQVRFSGCRSISSTAPGSSVLKKAVRR